MNKRAELEEAMQHYVSVGEGFQCVFDVQCIYICMCDVIG